MEEHAADCSNNWVCNWLGLQTLVVDESGDLTEAASQVNRSSALRPTKVRSIEFNSSTSAEASAPKRARTVGRNAPNTIEML
jgi:hypothetical protein